MLKKLYNIFEKPSLHRYGFLVQKFILLNILINIFSFSLPYMFKLDTVVLDLLNSINTITVFFFIIELLLRYIAIGVDKAYSGFKGRVKYTFQFYTLVDIISILPFVLVSFNINISYLRVVKLLRFIRILKLFRMKKVIKKFISINAFASSNLLTQSLVLISASFFFIYLFSYGFSSVSESAMVFLDPPQIAELHTNFQIALGVLELIVGLFIGGALISIITSSLEEIIKSINSGHFTYKDRDHIVIINQNLKLPFIFDEINKYYIDEQDEQDIVILLESSLVDEFKENVKKYSNLNIVVIAGDNLNWNSYERVNLNKAKKLLLLSNEDSLHNENKKVSKYITSHKDFNNPELLFVIEVEHDTYSKDIYNYIFDSVQNNYTLVNSNELIAKFLNRSVVNYDYFQIYSELLSFDGHEIYTVDYDEIFEINLTFKEISLKLSKGIIIGIIRAEEVLLNPQLDFEVSIGDKLIIIMEDRFSYKVVSTLKDIGRSNELAKPKLEEDSNIVIIGNDTDIDMKNITQFLTDNSIENLQHFVQDEGDYMNKDLWDTFNNQAVDVIILNLEDEDEFNLSLYLQSIYKDNQEFLSKIVNILHDPTIAMILTSNNKSSSMILSQKLIGEFISQSLFNRYTYDIFDEITQAKGNELYILTKREYSDLYSLTYETLRVTLLENNMIYIGSFINNTFIFNNQDMMSSDKIVVLTQGVS